MSKAIRMEFSTANIRTVMKISKFGDKNFETDFKYVFVWAGLVFNSCLTLPNLSQKARTVFYQYIHSLTKVRGSRFIFEWFTRLQRLWE